MKTHFEETQREHDEWQAKMASRAKERAQLEINLRVEDQKKAYYGLAFELATSMFTVLSIRRSSKAKLASSSL